MDITQVELDTFLKKHGAYKRYYKNLSVKPENHGYRSWFLGAFVWDETPEEKSYWMKLDKKWQKLIRGE